MTFDTTTSQIAGISPYVVFSGSGVVLASSVFILLLLHYSHSIPRYTKIFLVSGIGLLLGAKAFAWLAGLYAAMGTSAPLRLHTLQTSGIVFYGGMLGFLASFFLLCKIWTKRIDYTVVDLAVICVPLFHVWGRVACFFAGCCYGVESQSFFSVVYTTYIGNEVVTASRVPIQLVEALGNAGIFAILIALLRRKKFTGNLIFVYLLLYSSMRMTLEMFRADMNRGMWNGISFGQSVSAGVLISCIALLLLKKKLRKKQYENIQ